MRRVRRFRLVWLLVLLVALGAGAQEGAPPEASTPPPAGAPAPDPLPPPPDAPTSTPPPAAFFEQMLTVDLKGRVYEGRKRYRLSATEVFERLGRTDLLEESARLRRRRTSLWVAAAVTGVTLVATGAVLLGLAPSPATPTCEADVTYYNQVCVPRYQAYQTAGSAVLVTGIVAGSVLASLAWWTNPDVLSRDEMTALVAGYNARLRRQLSGGAPSGVRLLPFVGNGQGGLLAQAWW